MKQTTTQTEDFTPTELRKALPENHEAAKDIVFDEAMGSRDVEELAEKVVLCKELTREDLERIQKFARERSFYLDMGDAEAVRQEIGEVIE